jgi:hypothetical protein
MPFVNTAKTKIHNFWLAIPLGCPKMAAALPTKRLYPPIAAFCDFDIVLRRTGHLNVSNGGWQYRSKWRPRKDLAILAVACNDPRRIHDSPKRDCTAKTCPRNFHIESSLAINASTTGANILGSINIQWWCIARCPKCCGAAYYVLREAQYDETHPRAD